LSLTLEEPFETFDIAAKHQHKKTPL